jgi:hypothetical protein
MSAATATPFSGPSSASAVSFAPTRTSPAHPHHWRAVPDALDAFEQILARISAKSDLAREMANNMGKMAQIQGTADVMAEAVKV